MSEMIKLLVERTAAATRLRAAAVPPRERRRHRNSAGVVLVRRSALGAPELLLVHKRYTFAYSEFVHGRFSMRRGGRGDAAPYYEDLLRDMTVEELLLIHSLDFARMWYHVWLDGAAPDLYKRKSERFRACFLADGGARLRRVLAATVPAGATLWEPPKGRIGARETPLGAAVRELDEEAGIAKSAYSLLPGVSRRVVHESGGVRYETQYFVAAAGPRLTATGGIGRPPLRDLVASFKPRRADPGIGRAETAPGDPYAQDDSEGQSWTHPGQSWTQPGQSWTQPGQSWTHSGQWWGSDPAPGPARLAPGAGACRCAEISEARWFDTNGLNAIAGSGAAASADLLRLAHAAFNLYRKWERGLL